MKWIWEKYNCSQLKREREELICSLDKRGVHPAYTTLGELWLCSYGLSTTIHVVVVLWCTVTTTFSDVFGDFLFPKTTQRVIPSTCFSRVEWSTTSALLLKTHLHVCLHHIITSAPHISIGARWCINCWPTKASDVGVVDGLTGRLSAEETAEIFVVTVQNLLYHQVKWGKEDTRVRHVE